MHHEITDHFMVQAGVGARFVPDDTLPEAGARVIYTFSSPDPAIAGLTLAG